MEDTCPLGQDGAEDILAAEVGDGALLDLAVVALGLDDAAVFVDGAVGGGNFEGAHVPGKGTPSVGRGCGVGTPAPRRKWTSDSITTTEGKHKEEIRNV